ncbi:MAG: AraC family transcriptional regulator [Thermoanaerobaculia bacterium]
MFTYREVAPAPALARYVKCFWLLRADWDAPRTERIIPDGSFEMVFHFGDPFAEQPRAMLMGEIRRPVLLRPSRHADVLGVRFHPGGAAPFLGVPANALSDAILPLREVFPADLEEQVRDQASGLGPQASDLRPLSEARGPRPEACCIALIESTLIRRFVEPRGAGLARAAAARIARHHGALRIREVASSIGTTERSLARAFDASVGMSAKVYSRLLRFHAALRGEADGYFDDSHRIRDFREFSGATPTELQRERNAINDAFVGNVQD